MLFDSHSRTSCQDDGIQILASAGRKSRAVVGAHLFLAIRVNCIVKPQFKDELVGWVRKNSPPAK